MKNLIVSLLFVFVSVFGFTQDKIDTASVYNDTPLSIRVVPFKVYKNGKQKELKNHYIFQVSHNFIYCIDKNHNIKYTMEITKMSTMGDRIDILAKRFKGDKSEVFFSVPLKENNQFLVMDKKNTDTYTNVSIEIITEYDLYNKKGF